MWWSKKDTNPTLVEPVKTPEFEPRDFGCVWDLIDVDGAVRETYKGVYYFDEGSSEHHSVWKIRDRRNSLLAIVNLPQGWQLKYSIEGTEEWNEECNRPLREKWEAEHKETTNVVGQQQQ